MSDPVIKAAKREKKAASFNLEKLIIDGALFCEEEALCTVFSKHAGISYKPIVVYFTSAEINLTRYNMYKFLLLNLPKSDIT